MKAKVEATRCVRMIVGMTNGRLCGYLEAIVMHVGQLHISHGSVTIAAALSGALSRAIGGHAALNIRALGAANAAAKERDIASCEAYLADRLGDRQRPLSRRQRAADRSTMRGL
jgi:hypothetical protein